MGKRTYCSLYFAGASAEFAFKQSGRLVILYRSASCRSFSQLFSTVSYARQIVFSEKTAATQAIAKLPAFMRLLKKQECKIPAWVSRCAFMLIGYSISSFWITGTKTLPRKRRGVPGFYKVGKVWAFRNFLRPMKNGCLCGGNTWKMTWERVLTALTFTFSIKTSRAVTVCIANRIAENGLPEKGWWNYWNSVMWIYSGLLLVCINLYVV